MNKFKLGDYSKYECFQYPGGELQVRIKPNFIPETQSDNIILAKIKNPTQIMEALLLHDAVTECAGKMPDRGFILPYLPYSRADRRFVKGDCFGKEVFMSHFGNVVTLDAHSDKCEEFVTDIKPNFFIKNTIDSITHNTGTDEIVLLYPDEGAARRYIFSYNQNVLKTHTAYCSKKRDPETGKLSGFEVPFKEMLGTTLSCPIIIIDDLCDGGGTFNGIADALKEAGVTRDRLYLYVTHGIFSKGFEELSNNFTAIYTTNSFSDSLSPNGYGNMDLIVFDCDEYLISLVESMVENKL